MVVLAVVRLAVLAVVQVVPAVLQRQHLYLEAVEVAVAVVPVAVVEVAVAVVPPGAQVVGMLAAKALLATLQAMLLHVLVTNVQVVSLPAAVVLMLPAAVLVALAPAVVLAAVVPLGRVAVVVAVELGNLCQHLWHQEPEEPCLEP